MAKKVFVHKVSMPGGKFESCDIYVNDYDGSFSAKVGIDSHDSKDLQALRKWIDKTVKAQKEPRVDYDPYIEIFRIERERETWGAPEPSSSIRFLFKIVLLSRQIYEETDKSRGNGERRTRRFRLRQPGLVEPKKLTVYADIEWMERPGHQHESDKRRYEGGPDELGDIDDDHRRRKFSTVVPFTPQRYQAICAIRDAVEALRVRLDDLLVQQTPEKASEALDRTPIRALLAPPEETKPQRRKAS